jgi:hypothetical protein
MILENAAALEPALGLVAAICSELNSFDKRRVEEPDFERRMAIFKKVRDAAKDEGKLTELELKAVIYNCCFYLKHEVSGSSVPQSRHPPPPGGLLPKE